MRAMKQAAGNKEAFSGWKLEETREESRASSMCRP